MRPIKYVRSECVGGIFSRAAPSSLAQPALEILWNQQAGARIFVSAGFEQKDIMETLLSAS
jgi:hypothetical protein